MLKYLKKIYRVLKPKKFTNDEFFEITLQSNNLIKSYKKKADFYSVELINGIKLVIRGSNYSDYSVFKQIFNFKEYDLVLSLIKLNSNTTKENTIIIDAGANVGYTSSYFAHNLNSVSIYGVEPSVHNCEIYAENIKTIPTPQSVKIYNAALSEKQGVHYSIERDFRDKKDWSITTNENTNGEIKGISISEIINKNNLKYITLLKIDIEGAERFIFKTENDLSFLKITQIIAIEIHDEFNIRESILTILKSNDFVLLESGELTIGLNKSFFVQ
ncbi:MAG: FkbM family methyltransferase [Bacteroidia bacterium]|nr:FkbM family methyltransferase [Bacteroidia bacterium]